MSAYGRDRAHFSWRSIPHEGRKPLNTLGHWWQFERGHLERGWNNEVGVSRLLKW